MANASQIIPDPHVRLLYAGASSTGKTGSLISLLRKGYKLRVIDMDNGLDYLINKIKDEDASLLNNLDVVSARDKYKATTAGVRVEGVPTAYVNAMKFLNKWDDDTIPANWGTEYILVIDSLTALSRAAFLWAQGQNPTAKDPRQWYAAAQETIKSVLDMLTSKDFKANVIVISHVQLIEIHDGSVREYVTSVGKALGPEIPKFFNNLVLAEKSGQGANVKRTIRTVPTSTMDLKVAVPKGLEAALDLNTGLATLFEKLKPAA